MINYYMTTGLIINHKTSFLKERERFEYLPSSPFCLVCCSLVLLMEAGGCLNRVLQYNESVYYMGVGKPAFPYYCR